MKKSDLQRIIIEAISQTDILNSSEPISEIDFRKLQQKIGTKIKKLGSHLVDPSLSDYGASMQKNGNFGKKLDKVFNTSGHQARQASSNYDKNVKEIFQNLESFLKMWRVGRKKIDAGEVSPETVESLNSDLKNLIQKYVTKL